jgi:tetratricopeptide (TPR) repeat protein
MLEFDATNTMAYEQLMDIYADTDRYKYYICRANLHSVEQHFEHAINDYKKALAQEDTLAARFALAALYEQTGKNAKAIDEYLRVLDHEEADEEVYLKLANLYAKEGAPDAAIGILEKKDSPKIRENLAKLYLTTGQAQKALELTDDEHTKATALLDAGKYEQAKELVKKYPDLKARYYYETGDHEKALKAVDEFEKKAKNSPLPYQMRALIYENLEDDFNAHLNWGKYHILRGNKDIAINEFLEANRLESDNADLVARLAALYDEMGDKDYAMEFYEKLAKLEPKNKFAAQKLEEFGSEEGFLDKIFAFFKKM